MDFGLSANRVFQTSGMIIREKKKTVTVKKCIVKEKKNIPRVDAFL